MSRILVALLLVASLASAQTAPVPGSPATGKRPMTFEDLMAMKRLGDTAVSPDGKWLGYSVTTVNLDANTKTAQLFIQPIDAGNAAQPTAIAQPGDSGLQFSHDGKRVLFLSGREGGQQLWLADFDPATGAVSNQKKLTHIATEADNAKWSPDGRFIVFTSNVYPDCPAISPADGGAGDRCNAERDKALADSKVKAQIFTALLYRHWNHYTGEKRSHLFLADVATGAVRELTPNDPHDVPPFSVEGGGGFDISPDSKQLAFTENPDAEPAISTSAQIFLLDLTSPTARPEKISTSAGGNFNPAYSPDGKYLAWRSQARAGYEADKFRLMLYDRVAKTTRDLLPKFDNWVNEFAWDYSWIVFNSEKEGEQSVFRASPDLNDRFSQPMEAASFQGCNSWRFESGQVVATCASVHAPGEVFKFDGSCQSQAICNSNVLVVKPLTHLNDSLLSQLDLPEMESFWFTARDGVKVQGFVIRPPSFDPNKKYPVKFLIHGGPQGAWGEAWSYRWNAELFAANGYVVVMINPRGSTGYGQAFVDGVNNDWGGRPFTDLMTGLDYAEQHFTFIDKSRECALGASYGGYIANWILGHTNRFKCIVSHDGMFNAESAFGSTEEDWFNIWEFAGHPWDYYGKPDGDNPFRKWSPSLSAKNFKTPTLVVHSQLDYRLDVSEGFQLFDTLQLLHVPSKMLYFPDEGHWVLKPQNSRLWYKTVNDWVDQWTNPH